MPDPSWISGNTMPERQGFFEAHFSSGEIEVTMYSVLGWMPQAHRGRVERWRPLDPDIEQAEIERYLYLRSEGRTYS